MADDAVNLVTESGEVVNTDAVTAADLLRGGGFRVATGDEVAADLERQEYSDIGSQAAAFAEGAADELTLGGYSLAATNLGSDEYADDVRKRAEHSGGARTAGRVVAGVGSALATGGGSAVARGLAKTPAGMILRQAMRAEDVVSATRAGRVGALMTSGAIEGALFGAGEGISDAALSADERDRTAEAVFASAVDRGLDGLLLGGGAGLGLGLAAKGAGKVAGGIGRRAKGFRESLDAARAGKRQGATSARTGKAAATTGDAVEQQRITLRMEDGEGLPDPRTRMRQLHDGLGARRQLDDEIGRGSVEFAEAEDRARQAFDKIHNDEGSIAVKRRKVDAAFRESPPDAPEAIGGAIEEVLVPMREQLERLRVQDADVLAEVGGASKVKKALDRIDGALARMDAAGTDAIGDVFMAADDLKRTFGKIASGRNPHLQPIFADFYARTRGLLEDRAVWGARVVDEIQAPVNAAWTNYIPSARAFDGLTTRRDMVARTGSKQGFGEVSRAEASKIKGALGNLADVTKGNDREAIVQGIRTRKALAEAMETAYGADPKLVQQIRDAAEKQEAILLRSERLSKDAKAAEELLEDLSAVPGLGGAVQLTAHLATRASKLQSLYEAAGSGQASLTQKIGDLVQGGRRRLRGTAQRARGAAIVAGVSASQRDDSSRGKRERFKETAERVRAFETDPQGAVRQVVARAGGGQGAPLLSASLASTAARGAQHLLDTMPRGRRRQFGPEDDIAADRVSDTEIAQWLDRVDAVENPLGVIDEVAAGRVPRHKIETIKQVYPALFRDMQDAALDELESMDEPPDYDTRRAVGLILDLPVDESMSPDFVASMQRSASTAQEQPTDAPVVTPGNAKAPEELDDMHSTRAERLAGGF